MSKTLKTIAIIAGVVALTFAIPGVGTAIGTAIGVSITAGTAATISAIASAVSMAAGTAAQALIKPPPMQGTVSQVMIGANMPVAYAIGRSYIGGALIYDKSANGPDNYDRTQIFAYTAAGPIEEFQALQADYTTIGFSGADWNTSRVATGFYGADGGYLWLNTRKGLRPDTALTAFPGRAAFSSWGSNYKLSGYAAASVTMEFDEDGERWASGIPQWGMIAKWVKIYDPRLDTTYPGGSGAHRWDDESTWTWSENPALHALTYARGRFVNDIKVVGVGLEQEAIDVAVFVELANVCEANGWTVGGAVYEAPGLSKWDNLKRMLAAASAKPVWVGGVLSCAFDAPKTSLDTITGDDLADGPVEVVAMQSWRDRVNTIVPRYRSEAHKWEYVQANAVSSATYVTEDGEEKTKEVQYDLVQNVTQAAELAAYEMVNGREFGPINLTVKPRLMLYRPGEALTLNIPEAGLVNELAVITSRTVDPANGSIQLTLMSETTAKHAYALGQTGTAPPTPTIVDPADVDALIFDLDPGAQGLVAASSTMPALSPITITADYTGAIDPAAQLPHNALFKRYVGATDVSTTTAWSMTVLSGSITASIGAATGVVEITALGSTSEIEVTSDRDGVELTSRLLITKQIGPTPAGGSGGGTSASDSSFATFNSTTHAAVSDELTVTVGSAGSVSLTAPLRVDTSASAPTGTFEVFGRWQWYNPGTALWEDLGAEVASDPDAVVAINYGLYFITRGTLGVSDSKAGLTPTASHKFRLMARNASGTRVMSLSGTASAVAS